MHDLTKQALLERLATEDHRAWRILTNADNLQVARDRLFEHFDYLEKQFFNIYSRHAFKDVHIAERHIAKECIRVLKNVIRTENERIADTSALRLLRDIAKDEPGALDKVDAGFLLEFIHLLRGAMGNSGVLRPDNSTDAAGNSEAAISARSAVLDEYAQDMTRRLESFTTGLAPAIIKAREGNAKRILKGLGGGRADRRDWDDWRWHMSHLISDHDTIGRFVDLDDAEREGLRAAARLGIPVQITPYYLSLFNSEGRTDWDRTLRAQVMPSVHYCETVARNKTEGVDLDFMGERVTSPAPCITRRYPRIVIFKPYESCPQLCVYCQRNWEVTELTRARIDPRKIRKALTWLRRNRNISEVILTGGDPLSVDTSVLAHLVKALASMPHIERIRIGTRTLATLPFRFDRELVELLAAHNSLGWREVCVVTHFESAAELTPDVLDAVRRVRSAGISIYNQQVFTYYNSRRFETCHLRRTLKLCGIDPYYTFNTKGKEETLDFRVPIARIEQERKEEARLLPGLERTDEPVFNVPRIGKSHLRSWQDHEPIMIRPDGRRVYRFYPWEASLRAVEDYIYTDVSILEYLKRLQKDGENIDDYSSIWYYF